MRKTYAEIQAKPNNPPLRIEVEHGDVVFWIPKTDRAGVERRGILVAVPAEQLVAALEELGLVQSRTV